MGFLTPQKAIQAIAKSSRSLYFLKRISPPQKVALSPYFSPILYLTS